MSHFKGKVVLVTGSSRGIGNATAKLFAKHGATVIAHYGKSETEAKKLESEITKEGGKIFLVSENLGTKKSVDSLYAKVQDVLKNKLAGAKLHTVVNNAGIAEWTPPFEITEAQFDNMFAVNVKSLYFSCIEASKLLEKGGSIVNVSSVVASQAFPPVAAYSATKGAVDTLTINFAQMFGEQGIRVNAVAPGATETDMSSWLRNEEGANQAKTNQALKRVGQAEDIAEAIVSIAGDNSRWITGQTIQASGGWGL
jgi:3-oxoacyl-[acyl-carrier protein] reductase